MAYEALGHAMDPVSVGVGATGAVVILSVVFSFLLRWRNKSSPSVEVHQHASQDTDTYPATVGVPPELCDEKHKVSDARALMIEQHIPALWERVGKIDERTKTTAAQVQIIEGDVKTILTMMERTEGAELRALTQKANR